jgi:trigger factor
MGCVALSQGIVTPAKETGTMTDEPRPESGTENPQAAATPEAGTPPEATPEAAGEATAVATAPETPAAEGKLHQDVEIKDVGPCRKHIKVSVERKDIDGRIGEKFKELMVDAPVPGFRPGKAPRRMVERRFAKEVGDQVKAEVLLASLQQLAEDHDIAPLAAPDIDPGNIELPDEGPLVYEFEVEVRPQFDLPNYKGLRIRRPVHTFSEKEIEQEERRLLTPDGQIVPKENGVAELGDILVVDAVVQDGERQIGKLQEAQLRVNEALAFKDGVAHKFAEQVLGSKAGDTRTVDISLSSAAADPAVRGKTVQAVLNIKDVKTVRLPELTHEYLHKFGVHSPEQLRELVGVVLQRRLEYEQRRSAREQVMGYITAAATWQLPEDMLRRQASKAISRRVMEMRADGISEEEINGRLRLLQQDILRSTEASLKEHFVLQKLAEVEKIEVNDDDLNDEIDRIAAQGGESPRRVRARLERDDLVDALAAEMIERKALDLILDSAEYEDVPLGQEAHPAVSTTEAQAVPGEIHDPSAAPPETPAEGNQT